MYKKDTEKHKTKMEEWNINLIISFVTLCYVQVKHEKNSENVPDMGNWTVYMPSWNTKWSGHYDNDWTSTTFKDLPKEGKKQTL